jgi:threonine aldolase
MAARLAAGLTGVPGGVPRGVPGARLAYPTEANEVFVELPPAVIAGLEGDGAQFYRWGGADALVARLVCAFDTAPEAVDAFIDSARKHDGLQP